MYPGLERAISDWAQRAKHVNLQTPQPPQSASKVGSMMSDAYFPGLERAISNWAQHAQHVNPRCSEPAQTAIRAGSVMSEAFYPGLERAISNWAQHAQHVKPDLLPSSQPPPRAMSEAISEACYPGLERAISNWAQRAQQIQHELPQLAKSAASASRASSSALDEIYPGLEQAISDWARDAQFDLPAPMAQDLSSGLSSVSEEGSEEEGVTSAEPMEVHDAQRSVSFKLSDCQSCLGTTKVLFFCVVSAIVERSVSMNHCCFVDAVHLITVMLSVNVASHLVLVLTGLTMFLCAVLTGGSPAVEAGSHHLEPVLFPLSWPGAIICASQLRACWTPFFLTSPTPSTGHWQSHPGSCFDAWPGI